MARYDGMDELLDRVRGRLVEERQPDVETAGANLEVLTAEYEVALHRILTLLHDAEQLHTTLKGPEYRDMPMGQVEGLLSILDKVQRELRRGEAALQR